MLVRPGCTDPRSGSRPAGASPWPARRRRRRHGAGGAPRMRGAPPARSYLRRPARKIWSAFWRWRRWRRPRPGRRRRRPAASVGLGAGRLGVDQFDRGAQARDLGAQRSRCRPWWRSRRGPAAPRRPPQPGRCYEASSSRVSPCRHPWHQSPRGDRNRPAETATSLPAFRLFRAGGAMAQPRRDHGRISIGVPISTRCQISSISSSVTAMQPLVQLNRQCSAP